MHAAPTLQRIDWGTSEGQIKMGNTAQSDRHLHALSIMPNESTI